MTMRYSHLSPDHFASVLTHSPLSLLETGLDADGKSAIYTLSVSAFVSVRTQPPFVLIGLKFSDVQRRYSMRPRIVVATFFAILVTACDGPDQSERAGTDALQQAKDAQSRWKELCASEGGVEIYRTVNDVEGVLLRGGIPSPRSGYTAPMWPGAAFTTETGDDYIGTFLGYEHSGSRTMPVSPERRGYVTLDYQDANPSNVPGYRFVDVIDEETGERFRYTKSYDLVGRKDVNAPSIKLQLESNPDMDLDVYGWRLRKSPTDEPLPRYAVDLETPIIMDQREQGLLSGLLRLSTWRMGASWQS